MVAFKDGLRSRLDLPEPLPSQLPAGYQRVGSIALLELAPALREHRARIALAARGALPWATAIAERGPVRGELRKPAVRALWPSSRASLRTVHREDGIRYALDLREVMFSKGNVKERHRIVPRAGEIVADLFAGIGYFALPLARAGARVYAIEKDPKAFAFLQENIALNRLVSIVPILGDCRRIALPEPADRVLLGYFPRTERYLPAALAACKDRAVLHFHNAYRTAELWTRPEAEVRAAARKAGFTVRLLNRRVVKPLSPSLRHAVLDVAVTRASRKRTSRSGRAPALAAKGRRLLLRQGASARS